jgi:hypothetical protein
MPYRPPIGKSLWRKRISVTIRLNTMEITQSGSQLSVEGPADYFTARPGKRQSSGYCFEALYC